MDLRSLPPGAVAALAVLAALALMVAIAQAVASAWRRGVRRRRIVARVARAGEGEARARGWLESMGFDVLGAQVAATYPVTVDGRTVAIGVRADYIVRAREDAPGVPGARYVVEVKTGSVAPRIETPATRRQLLEYRIAFDVDGVLLLDAETARVHAVTFPGVDGVNGVHGVEVRGGGGARWTGVIVALLAVALVALAAAVSRAG